MKCLVFSDSHGTVCYMRRALDMHPDCDVVFFLGDGLADAYDMMKEKGKFWILVRGNCDYDTGIFNKEIMKTERITLSGYKIVATHGDLYGVKYGVDGVRLLAEREGCDLVLFGHTHSPEEKYFTSGEGAYYLFNPGSIGRSYGNKASYGLITLTDSGILLSHGYFSD